MFTKILFRSLAVTLFTLTLSAATARAVTIETVPVGDLGNGRWDWAGLVLYPTRAAFLEVCGLHSVM